MPRFITYSIIKQKHKTILMVHFKSQLLQQIYPKPKGQVSDLLLHKDIIFY